MSTIAPSRPAGGTTPRRTGRRRQSWLSRNALRIYAAIAFVYLSIPVLYTLAFSFNDAGRSNLVWRGFTLDNWTNICGPDNICASLRNSIVVGLVATVLATILGTMVAFALSRHRFRGRSTTNLLIFLPMATPEVVMGSSLLTLFLNMRFPLGFPAVAIAHIMFCISFVIVTVKARVAGLDPRLEQAAMDLYADERQTFWKVTFPLVAPGIAAGALLALSLSFDDFIITYFNAGSDFTTFPVFVWVSSQKGVPAQANVIGSLMFVVALSLVILSRVVGRRRQGPKA